MKKTEPEYYPPVENLLDLIYEHYTENNPVEKNTVAGKTAKAKEKELEEWLRGLDGMDRLVDDYVGDKIPLWEKIMDRQGTVCCAWEKTAFEEGLKVGIRLMMGLLWRGCVFLFFRFFSFFLLRCNFVARVDCHAHADQRAASEILVSLHQLFAACVEASCHTGKCAE